MVYIMSIKQFDRIFGSKMAQTLEKSANRKQNQRLSRAEQKAQRTHHILDATWRLFCAKGYDAVSLDAVAEEAGYSRMPIYSLFGDKQALFFALWQDRSSGLADLFLKGTKPGAPLAQNLDQLAHNLMTGNGRTPKDALHENELFFVAQSLCLNRPDLQAEMKTLADDLIARFAKMIERSSLKGGQCLRAAPEIVAQHLLAQINGAATVQFQTGSPFIEAESLGQIFLALATNRLTA